LELVSVHYHELALKGGNRPRFERTLRKNLERALAAVAPCTVRSAAGRVLVATEGDAQRVLARVLRVCGVAFAMPVQRLPRDLEAVGPAAARLVSGVSASSFRISAKRADKRFPMTSVDINREVGRVVHETTGLPVRLQGADAEVHLTVLKDEILVGTAKHPGPGGLPVGTGGRVAALMSGGIDSPVAAWRLIRRGCRCELVHFHSHPLVDRTTQEKARDLAEVLSVWQLGARLHLAPLAEVQKAVRLHCPDPLRVILYRRFMVRIAEVIARRRKCRALVTGESLGQVASQTLENLATVDAAATMPVLRPLVGTDKQEIIEEARRLETYEISIRPDQDCCRLFVPSHPATAASVEEVERAEEALDVAALVRDAVARTETVTIE